MDFGCEPAVELAFAEGSGENCEIYTVRRVPRHLKRSHEEQEKENSVKLQAL